MKTHLVTKRKEGERVDIRKRMASKLKKLRNKKDAGEVAKACKISRSSLGMYETGKRIPRDDVKVRIAKYYNTSVQEIFFA